MVNDLEGGNLIFLISQPRAGSTLLQLMLTGNPEIATTSEPWISLHPFFALREIGVDSVYNSRLAHTALLDFLKESGVDISFYKSQIATLLITLYSQAMNHQGKKFFLDKTPRYYHIIDELLEVFPKAKFIILIRNPLAVLNSILKTWVKDDFSFLGNFMEDLVIAPQKLLKCAKNYPERCLIVNYEKLVSEPETVLKGICQSLGIDYFENMPNYGGRINSEWQLGDKVGAYSATRPITEAMNKWKNAFDQPYTRQLAVSYLESLGPTLIEEMGYNYDEIYNSVKLAENHSDDNLMSWQALMNVISGLSSINDVRRAAFFALTERTKRNFKSINYNEDFTELVEKMVIRIIAPKINELTSEVNKVTKQRNDMIDTLSWRLTEPARNSRVLKAILDIYRKIK